MAMQFEALNNRAFELLSQTLRQHGNPVGKRQQEALKCLIKVFTAKACGRLGGKVTLPLPTGYGKTSALVAWIAATQQLEFGFSIVVSASKVEALCTIKRDLQKLGVAREVIGIKHSKKFCPAMANEILTGKEQPKYASEPSDRDISNKQIVLVTHQRFNTVNSDCNAYRGNPRDIAIYDESLFRSFSKSIKREKLAHEINELKINSHERKEYQPLINWLTNCLQLIDLALFEQAQPLTFSIPDCPKAEEYKAFLVRHSRLPTIESLLSLAGEKVRTITEGRNKGILHYKLINEEADNLIILDASYPIRSLLQMDKTIKDGSRYLSNPSEPLKTYQNLTVYQMYQGGGRETLTADFAEPSHERIISREIAEVVKGIPENESILFITYKKKEGTAIDFMGILKDDLSNADISIESLESQSRPRFNFLTWGNETSTNDFAHCSHVFLVGVIQRDRDDLAGCYIGQKNDLTAEINREDIDNIVLSESCHAIYQALSRGSSRLINEQGEASKMNAYIIHFDYRVEKELLKVLPGVNWKRWKTVFSGDTGKTMRMAYDIRSYLKNLPLEQEKISTSSLYKALGISNHTASTRTTSLRRALEVGKKWVLNGRSVVRLSFYLQTKFKEEPIYSLSP